MKKNTTASKTSLRQVAREQLNLTRNTRKIEQPLIQPKPKRNINHLLHQQRQPISIEQAPLKLCNNCKCYIDERVMKLHMNVCTTRQRNLSEQGEEFQLCKHCKQYIPAHLLISHVGECISVRKNKELSKHQRMEPPRHSEYTEYPKECSKEGRHQVERIGSQKKRMEMQKSSKEPTRKNNLTKKQPVSRANNQQGESLHKMLARARTNDIQQRLKQKAREQRIQRQRIEKERAQRRERQRQQQRERQRQLRQRQRIRQRERVQHQQQQEPQRQATSNTRNRRRNNRRRGRSNSRRPRRQNSMPGVSFFPLDIFQRIQSGFEEFRINSSSFQQQMENLSAHFGNLMQNISHMMSPLGNHRRRVILYQQDIYPEVSVSYDSGPSEQQDEGLDPEQINQIPVHQFNSRRQQQNAATTNKSCVVCLSDFVHGDTVKSLYCSHKFHQDCIDRWLQMKGTCPVCRQDLRS